METIPGDDWVKTYSRFIKANEAQFVQASRSNNSGLLSWVGLGSDDNNTSNTSSSSLSTAALLRLDPHHLFYLLIRFEALGLSSGQLDVRAPRSTRPISHFSFISANGEITGKDKDDTMSVNSFRSTISTVSAFSLGGATSWLGLSSASAPQDPTRDLKVIYSAFTKMPSLRLNPVALRSKLIKGFEDCPGTNSVPLDVFKNLSLLQLEDIDPRVLLGWDRLSCQLRSLSCRKSGVEDLADLLVDSVVNDTKRRRGESVIPRRRIEHGPSQTVVGRYEITEESHSSPSSGTERRTARTELARDPKEAATEEEDPEQPKHPIPKLPTLAWYFLRHLDLSHNSLTFLTSPPLEALTSLASLDLSSNLLNAVPSSLSVLPSLSSVNLSDNMIESIRGKDVAASLATCKVLSLARNRLESIAGVEALTKIERIDLRGNHIEEPQEIGRLAVLDKVQEVWCKGNFFEEEIPDWRVDIFVEFAKEGRRMEGPKAIKIDDEIPGYFERQRVLEKVPIGSLSQYRGSASSSDLTSRCNRGSTPDASHVLLSAPAQNRSQSQLGVPISQDAKTISPPVKAVISSRRKKQSSTSNPSTRSNTVLQAPLSERGAERTDVDHRATLKEAEDNNEKHARRRNRRIVDLDMGEAQSLGKGKEKEKAGGSEDSEEDVDRGDMNELSESEVIKRAARAGQVEEALGEVQKQDESSSTRYKGRLTATTGIASKSQSIGRSSRKSQPSADLDAAPSSRIVRPNSAAIIARRKGVTTSLFEPSSLKSSANSSEAFEEDREAASTDDASSESNTLSHSKEENGAARSEAWRRRIENLKGEVGDDWLRLVARGDYDSGGRMSVGRSTGKDLRSVKKAATGGGKKALATAMDDSNQQKQS